MKKVYPIVLLLLCPLVALFAQEKSGRIKGSVKDDGGKPIEAATVELLKSADSSVAKIAVSDKLGDFVLDNLNYGKYIVSFSAVGHDKKLSDLIDLTSSNPNVELSSVNLTQSKGSLSEVTVVAKKPMVEIKIDKTVVNVDAFITNAGGTAMDVLEKSPGVSVDRDGNISLKGKQGVIILVDGKQTFLAGQDLANYLKNLPANQLDQLEIMTQPSAKYDASGNSGIINIKTKKGKQAGFNGTINLAYIQAVYPKSPNSINVNFRRNKVNLFASAGVTYWQGFSETTILRKFGEKDNLDGIFDQTSNNSFQAKNFNARVGMDYSVSKNTTIGFSVNGTYNPRKFGADSKTDIMSAAEVIDSTNVATSWSKDPWKNWGGNLNFRRVLDTSGSEITADLDYMRYHSRSNQVSNNYTYYQPMNYLADSFLLKGYLPSDIFIYSGKIDYSHPLKNNARFEAGVKSSYVKTDNDAQYTIYDDVKGDWINDSTRSNHFIYTENINAAYVNFSKQFTKLGVQAGLRAENTNSNGHQVTDNTTFKKNYTQLFPTLYISYNVNKNNTLGFSYGRRIERPNYRDMNPFQYFLDQYTYYQGNPYLTPQFSHNIEVSHNYKGKLNTTLNYTETTDIIDDILSQNDSTKVTFQTKQNIARRVNIGLAVSLNTTVTKWWTISLYGNVFNNHYEGLVNNIDLNTDLTSFQFNGNNQFKFSKGWGGEMSGYYQSTMQDGGIIIAKPMGMISFGISKQILKTKGTIKLNLNDPFYLQKFRGYTKFGNIDTEIESKWDGRRIGLNFTYRFGKMQNNSAPRRRGSSSQEEQNRVGGGQQQ